MINDLDTNESQQSRVSSGVFGYPVVPVYACSCLLSVLQALGGREQLDMDAGRCRVVAGILGMRENPPRLAAKH